MNPKADVIAIAIDGPSSSGKSTIAKGVSKRLGMIYIDTGAMYRAAALKAIRAGIETGDREAVGNMLPSTDISIRFVKGAQRVLLDGEDVSDLIRTQEVSNGASKISAIKECRKKLVELQRKLAEGESVVMDGRDIGTNVLPNARFKFYVTADADVRAMRRYLELKNADRLGGMTYEDILAETHERDERDSNRSIDPLRMAEDSVLVDTTHMSADEAIDFVVRFVTERI